ncbi:MinD/ParA family protein [Fusibacter sp. JL216-2]|uniref:MinD/ParA family protein n=1 Tax=Fusibacter sp. JL216-2 TaxID=3071453 RepID=UPI003D34765D
MDQAQRLREIIYSSKLQRSASKDSAPTVRDARIITVSSGKGGVGKTNFTVNLAIALSRLGKNVSIIDADLGLANIDVVLGLVPKFTLSHVIRNEKEIKDIILDGPNGIRVISGGSGVTDLVNLDTEEIARLIESLEFLNDDSDYILIDTGAGLSRSVISFIEAASDVVMVITPDPTSITDAYAVIKNIASEDKNIKVVVNRVDSNKEGQNVFFKLNSAAKKFLNVELDNLGYIYEDNNVKKAVRSQRPFLLEHPNCLASRGVELIAYNIENNKTFTGSSSGFTRFIEKLFKAN